MALCPLSHLLQVDSLCDGWDKAQLKMVTMEMVNSGQLEGMLHIDERYSGTLYNGHLWGIMFWPLYRGGLC